MATITIFILKCTVAFLLVISTLTVQTGVQGRYMSSSFRSSVSCPRPEFIQPCSCRMTVYGMHVVCLRVTDYATFSRIVTILKDYELGTLLFQESRLPPGIQSRQLFQGMKVVVLRLVASELPWIAEESQSDGQSSNSYVFDGLGSYLKRIDITKCNVGNGVGHLGLGRLPNLNEINVLQERLGTVEKNWFDNLSMLSARAPSEGNCKIKVVRLEDSAITSVDSHAFSALNDLVVLSLAKNSINEIKRNILPNDAQALTTIDFSNNALTDLPEDFFNNLPALAKVLLYNNRMVSLRQTVWDSVFPRLDTLWIYDNPLVCDNKMNWIIRTQKPKNLAGVCDAPEQKRGTHLSDIIALTSEALADAAQ